MICCSSNNRQDRRMAVLNKLLQGGIYFGILACRIMWFPMTPSK